MWRATPEGRTCLHAFSLGSRVRRLFLKLWAFRNIPSGHHQSWWTGEGCQWVYAVVTCVLELPKAGV